MRAVGIATARRRQGGPFPDVPATEKVPVRGCPSHRRAKTTYFYKDLSAKLTSTCRFGDTTQGRLKYILVIAAAIRYYFVYNLL
jgi:hypothetical protein